MAHSAALPSGRLRRASRIPVAPDGQPRTTWTTQFARTLAEELRNGVASGALTWAEADELLARLRVLVDQALEPQLG